LAHSGTRWLWLAALAGVFPAAGAGAEVVLWKPESTGFEVFTTGRVGVFASGARGDGLPEASTYSAPVLTDPTRPYDPVSNPWTAVQLHQVKIGAGGIKYIDEQHFPVLNPDGTASQRFVSQVNHYRIRSGFVPDLFGLGVRHDLGGRTRVTGFISYGFIVDTTNQQPVGGSLPAAPPDAIEGYVKLEGPWGAFLAGRTGTLFDRGAVVTDYLYVHGYGLGFPGDLTSAGAFPTAGQIGFGVLANGYAAGLVYSTPEVLGVQLNGGIFDPLGMTGSSVERTKAPRIEFELTASEAVSSAARVYLYFNGGYQQHYRRGATDDGARTSRGIGYGGRLEVGPLHIGAGGHRGTGISMTYMGIPGEATYNDNTQFRDTSGAFVMAQLVLGRFDLNGAYGRTVVEVVENDRAPYAGNMPNPRTGQPDPQFSWIHSQTGISVAAVYHLASWLHLDADAMFTNFGWSLGERQRINFYSAGTTVTW